MQLRIKNIHKNTETTFSLILEKPKDFSFYPGQYLDMELPVTDPNSNSRTFTISSSPTEPFLMITTRKGISPFKKFMEKLQEGTTITTSHPVGTFILDESEPAIFLAGGIGITPFRSIIKYSVDKKLKTPMTLVYSNSDDNFLFKDELNLWQKQLHGLKVIYYQTSIKGRLDITKLDAAVQRSVTDIFYLAGPPSLVDDFEKILLQLGIDSVNIRTDRFDGY